MAQIICKSKHNQSKAEAILGGVRFFRSEAGLISEDISEEKVEEFIASDGSRFELHVGETIEPAKRPVRKTAVPPTTASAGASPGF